MSEKDSAQNVIDSYRKRQQAAKRAPLILGIAGLLLIIGAAAIIFWLLGPERPAIALFATDTPTPTVTNTPTALPTQTNTPTITPTETATPTVTLTPTVAGPFTYQVQEGDNLFAIADKFGVDLYLLMTINNIDPANPVINPGDTLTIPGPDTELPTATPLPTNLPRGTRITYRVQSGDSLAYLALQFNSTVDAIKEANDIENENDIFVGQELIIPVNLVTPIPTSTPTATGGTPAPTVTEAAATETPTTTSG